MQILKTLGLTSLLSLACAAPAFAHHSYAMFDAEKILDLQGTIKEVQWTQPHSWLQFLVADKQGKIIEWSFEMGPGGGGPTGLTRQAFKLKNLQVGDKMVARIHPLKNGSFGGELISLTLPDGTRLGGREPIPKNAE